ncbi:glycosyltransferase family 71 protein [Dothistroma septosporum NZE10]|uniref:Glycosyltransferase family 71 protein n=1 Tax=Dothistroma septosporum (strain NZE10 / CBS 128990) TaxID=675120 RepID=N1PZQ6_DOTSN|nr:glycosyltransferase family 71 protein [Dothistroma septosporum NZE10]
MAKLPYWVRRYQRLFVCRLLAVSITGTLLCMLIWPRAVASRVIGSDRIADDFATPPEREPDTIIRAEPTQYEPVIARPQKPMRAHDPIPRQDERLRAPEVLRPDEDLSKSIQEFSHFLSDDMRSKALLEPIVATGEALLRDLAYRVRHFRAAFAMWESLHLIEGQGLHRRHDIMQHLRAADISAAGRANAVHTYDQFRFLINGLASRLFPWTTTYLGDHMSLHASFYTGGRGIALTAGEHQVSYLLTSIPSFRKLGCELPIEVLYLGDDDMTEESRERLEALPNVITRDLTQMIEDKGWTLKGWAAKPFAILMSSFREVIFIDADALFFTNPGTLFEDAQYRETGALFFKDRNLSPESKRKWLKQILPAPISPHVKKNRLWTGESGHMQDSGVVVVDKWKHFIPLLLTTRLNGPDRDGNEATGKKGVYEMVYGDKETFWLSWELADVLDYSFHDSVTGNMGTLVTPKTKPLNSSNDDNPESEETEGQETEIKPSRSRICSAQLLHFDSEGKPFWFNGWLEKHKHDENSPLDFADFDAYMKEPSEVGRRPKSSAWDIKPDNVVCLQSEEHFEFSNEESEVLEMIKDIARAGETE